MRILFAIFMIFYFMNTQGITIQGNVLDIKTKLPVQLANVYIENKIGTTTNNNGNFILYFNDFKSNEKLYISCIGYASKVILLREIDTIKINSIELNPIIYNLDEFEVKSSEIKPYELLKMAFESISVNYKKGKHYYKGLYFEQISNFDKISNLRSRNVNCAVIVEDPGYNKFYNNWFGNIKENIYILGINKGFDSLKYTTHKNTDVNEANYLMWAFEKNYCRYKTDYFSNPDKYIYRIYGSYYDSLLKETIIQINISPQNPKKDVIYGEIFISRSNYKIYKIHILYKSENYDIQEKKKDKYYYKNLNSDIVVLYKPDYNNEMILSYIKYEFGDGFFSYEQNKPYMIFKKYLEYKVIGEVENGEKVIKNLTKMANSTNIYDYKVINNKSFWNEYNLITK